MSILLESLEQKEPESSGNIPDVHASHFDDEMLGDEWLLTRVKIWQRVSVALMVLLMASWGCFLFYDSEKTTEVTNSVLQSNNQKEEVIEKKADQSLVKDIKDDASNKPATKIRENEVSKNNIEVNKPSSIVEQQKNKVVYQPKKREVEVATSSTLNQKKKSNGNSSKTIAPSKSQNPAIFLEDLPANIKNEFPSIELGSYVVSDDSSNSFVILDGGFYKVNQVIAPEMVLRDINTQHILVEFKGYFVKLPHKQ